MPTRGINRGLVLTLIALESDVRFPLSLEVTLFSSDALGGTEDRIATEVFVPLLHETHGKGVGPCTD